MAQAKEVILSRGTNVAVGDRRPYVRKSAIKRMPIPPIRLSGAKAHPTWPRKVENDPESKGVAATKAGVFHWRGKPGTCGVNRAFKRRLIRQAIKEARRRGAGRGRHA